MKPVLLTAAALLFGGLCAFAGYEFGHRAGFREGQDLGDVDLPDPFSEPEVGEERRAGRPTGGEERLDRASGESPPEEPSRRDETGADRRRGPVAAAVIAFDADGAELGRHVGATVARGDGSVGLLVSAQAIAGSHAGRVELGDGRAGRLRDVLSLSPGRALALVSTDLSHDGYALAEAALHDESEGWCVFAGDAVPHPVRIEGEESVEIDGLGLVVALRLAMRVPQREAVLLNADQDVVGLVTTHGDDDRAAKAVALSAAGSRLSTWEPVELSLADYHAFYFAGSVDALLREARKRAEEGRFAAAVAAFRRALGREPSVFESIRDELRAAHVGGLRGVPAETRAAARFDWLVGAVDDLPSDGRFQLELADVALKLQRWEEALAAYERAWRVDPGLVPDLDAVLATTYLAWGGDHDRRGRQDDALAVFERAVRHVPGSAQLWRAYGLLLITVRDYAGATAALREAVALDRRLAAELDPVIARAERFAEGPGKVIIDYPPGSRSIITRVAINGAVGEFIVDTGATSSFVPVSVAEAAGLDLGARVPRRIVRTAGGERTLPYSPVNEIRVGDLAIGGISVIVGDLPGMGNRGLLGMDFLGSFTFENDSSNGRLVIYEK